MEENILKQKYNDLLDKYKKGAEYIAEHPEDEKAKSKLEKIEIELSNIMSAFPDMTEKEKTEGFIIENEVVESEVVEEKTDEVKPVENKSVVVKENVQPVNNFSSFKDNWQIAVQLAKSDIIPDAYKNKPQNIIIAISIANQMNLEPFTVMQNMALIKGRAAWSGSFCRFLIERTGKFKDLELNYTGEKDKENYGCYLSAKRVSDGKIINGPKVTMAMAKAEKWTNNPKWSSLTELMLAYRCQSYFCRVYCPEAMAGIYTTEEVEDMNTKREQPTDIL